MTIRRPVDLSEAEMQIAVRALACLSLFKGDRFRCEKIASRFEGGEAGYMRQRRSLLRELLPGFAGQLDEDFCNTDLRDHVDALRGFPDEEFGGIILPMPVIVGDPEGPTTLEMRGRDSTHQFGPISDLLDGDKSGSCLILHMALPLPFQIEDSLWIRFPKDGKEYRLGYVVDAIERDTGMIRIVGFIDFASLPKSMACVDSEIVTRLSELASELSK